ncbi:MAG: protease inhibitor I42 family protein [Desulforhabdus sp.]|jgi:inhibitor of cysteine peptidase|nr:protease inhibitor I42 family protein [Desulforhabdus sp.]
MKKLRAIAALALICSLLTATQEIAATEQKAGQIAEALQNPSPESKLAAMKIEEKKDSTLSQTEHQPTSIQASPGEEFAITLQSNPTTGYRWELAAPLEEEVVKLVGNVYQSPETKLIGAGGQEVWTFKAVGQGEIIIQMKYVRPWEKDIPPVQTKQFKVVVIE